MQLLQPEFHPETAVLVGQTAFADFAHAALEEDIHCVHLQGVQSDGAELDSTDWKNCLIESCQLHRLVVRGSCFTDVLFRGCDLSNADLSNCVFNRVRFADCKLTGANLFACGFHDVLLAETLCDYATFTDSRASRLLFESCTLVNARLNGVSGKEYGFSRCELRGVDFRDTALSGVNLSGCDIEGASFSENSLQGAIVSPLQACELAKKLGVIITE